MTRFDEMLQSAVNAASPSVPEEFLHATARMIDRLPRKERHILRGKLSFGLVLVILLCMLTAGAVAAVLLTGPELVEQEVVPMALENDDSARPLMFSHEELQHIAALVEENGVLLSENILQALALGDGCYETGVITDLASSAYGPEVMSWTIEQQHWFYTMLEEIGFRIENTHLLPGSDDLSCEAAYTLARQHILDEGWRTDPAVLDDRERYTLYRSFSISHTPDGAVQEAIWFFRFAAKDLNDDTYTVLMNRDGTRLYSISRDPGLSEILISPEATYADVMDQYIQVVGEPYAWPPEVYIAFAEDLRQIDVSRSRTGRAFAATDYIRPPEGALTSDEARELAFAACGERQMLVRGTMCFMVDGCAVWKVVLSRLGGGVTDMVELDAMTGEILAVYEPIPKDGAGQYYVPQSVWEAEPALAPNG